MPPSSKFKNLAKTNTLLEKTKKAGKKAKTVSLGSSIQSGGFEGLNDEDVNDSFAPNPETELQNQLKSCLTECSRQRLRAFQMSLRRFENSESRISTKDLNQVFQEHQIKLSPRAFQMLQDLYEDHLGIDYERMFKCMVVAQTKTGRDSVLANNNENDISASKNHHTLSTDQRDADLVSRLKAQLGSNEAFDMQELRNALQVQDRTKAGKLPMAEMLRICHDVLLPVYGAVLNGLLKRCDDERNGMVSWPGVMMFLDKAQGNARPTKTKSGLSTSGSLNDSVFSSKDISIDTIKESDKESENSSEKMNRAPGQKEVKGQRATTAKTRPQTSKKTANKPPSAVSRKETGKPPASPRTAESVKPGASPRSKHSPTPERDMSSQQMNTSAIKESKPDLQKSAVQINIAKPQEKTTKDNLKATEPASNPKPATLETESKSQPKPSTTTKPNVNPTQVNTSEKEPQVKPSLTVVSEAQPPVNPSKPSTTETKPGVNPSQPSTTETKPGVNPSKPSTTETKPGVNPSQPSTTDAKPGINPSQPSANEVKPGINPSLASTTETKPGVNPSLASATETKPGVNRSLAVLNETHEEASLEEHSEAIEMVSLANNAPKAKEVETRPKSSGKKGLFGSMKGLLGTPDQIQSPAAEVKANVIETTIRGEKMKFWAPDDYVDNKSITDPPGDGLKLEWVYGYRGNDCRSNIHVLANDEIAYFIGSVAVLYNRTLHSQRHYREHTEEIKCIAVHPNGMTLATGQDATNKKTAADAHVRIWRADSLQTLHVLGMGVFTKSVAAVAFSKTKERLVVLDDHKEHLLSVWDVTTGKEVARTMVNNDVMCDIGFSSNDPNILVTIGREHQTWWKIYTNRVKDPENALQKNQKEAAQPQSGIEMHAKPEYGTFFKARFVICMLHTEKGDLITGDSNGTIYVWGGGNNAITNYVKHAHDGPVFSLLAYKNYLLSGGRDGMVVSWVWNKNMDEAGNIKVKELPQPKHQTLEIPKLEGGVRMLVIHNDILLIGTTTNSILVTKIAAKGCPLTGVELQKIPLTQGHFDDVRGLSIVQLAGRENDIITVGYDGIICCLNTATREAVWKHMVKGLHFLCADLSITGEILVAGTNNGELVIFDIQHGDNFSISEQAQIKITKDKLTSVKLSADGNKIAIGTKSLIVIMKWTEVEESQWAWQEMGQCQGHSGSVTGLDWNIDGTLLQSSSDKPEFCIWNIETCHLLNPEEQKNQRWLTHTSKLGFPVTGVWHCKQGKEADISSVEINPAKTLVAMGNSQGYISLFKYPCCKEGSYSHTYRGSNCPLPNIGFTTSGRHLITLGGRDACLMQWKII